MNFNYHKDTDCVCVCGGECGRVCVGVCGVCISLLTEWFYVSDFQIPEVFNECVSIPGSLVCIAILYRGT